MRSTLQQSVGLVNVFRELGLAVTLELTIPEVAAFSVEDAAAVRELGATEAMLDVVRALAPLGGRRVVMDFERQTVTVF